ncbi:hypothetical protein BGZ99_000174 [Dissophora globulifera]|uniref:Uncharacterized protein n=1 Tax=Dissophora globulifera TaxID=979702 RepID=A0A9P6R1I0_9FUNG|nr:hypothetical protein BGZ99_000174 [Dissophora globulifera]
MAIQGNLNFPVIRASRNSRVGAPVDLTYSRPRRKKDPGRCESYATAKALRCRLCLEEPTASTAVCSSLFYDYPRVLWNAWEIPSSDELSHSGDSGSDGYFKDVDAVRNLKDIDAYSSYYCSKDDKPDLKHPLKLLPSLLSVDEFDGGTLFNSTYIDVFDDFTDVVAIPDDDWDISWDSEDSDSECSADFDDFKDVAALPEDDFECDF